MLLYYWTGNNSDKFSINDFCVAEKHGETFKGRACGGGVGVGATLEKRLPVQIKVSFGGIQGEEVSFK